MEVSEKVKDENGCIEQQGATQTLHMRGNSDSELQALFDHVLKPSSQMPLQRPFKMRKLPPSFFTPPAHRQSPAPTVSHSRESSADSTYGSGGTVPPNRGISPTPPAQQPQHFRHHSSPASLQQSLSIAQPPSSVHARQHSYDALADDALPHGWAQANTPEGQIYYLNHVTQSTTWEDPRKKQPPLQSLPTSSQSIPPTAIAAPPQFSSLTNKTAVAESTVVTSTAPNSSETAVNIRQVLPEGWDQGISLDGEVYFIHHPSETTSWFDPRIPRRLQTAVANKLENSPSPLITMTQNQQNSQLAHVLPPLGPANLSSSTALQRLTQEREKLKQRRQEIARQDVLPRRPVSQTREDLSAKALSEALPRSLALQPQQSSPRPMEINSRTMGSNSRPMEPVFDPFIMANTDFHARQESADSGLGLGSNYTHPHTPEDFLTQMEDVEITPSEELKQNAANPMMGPELESMDSEDLVPSITINEDLSAEFLNDMLEPAKLENLPTWL